MNASPKVSVIIPTHNRPHTLPRAIHSVLQQGYADIELIVVDDASNTAAAAEIVANFALTDPRIRYIRREVSGGAAAARNTGIEAAMGEFIAFQDDDDEWLPGKLERQMALMAELGEECQLVGGPLIRYVADVGIKVFSWPASANSSWVDTQRFVEGCSAFLQTTLIRKSALKKIGGFNPDVPISEDYEMVLRLLDHGRLATVQDFVTIVYEQSGANLSGQKPLRVASNLKILELHAKRLKTYPLAVGLLNYEAAVSALRTGQRGLAARFWLGAFTSNPWVLRVYLLLPMLILGPNMASAMIGLSERLKRARR
ncbi:MAG: glycosyltransferase family 2 protein [Pseudomonadota bacterium]